MARTDLWSVGLVAASARDIAAQPARDWHDRVRWLPFAQPWRFVADPFGVRRGNVLHVFVEALDYRRRPRGRIDHWGYDLVADAWAREGTVIGDAFHRSYPFVFDHEGTCWMVPECSASGETALWRATDAQLMRWQREVQLLPLPGVDATPLHAAGRWWLFFTLPGAQRRDCRELHVAWAPTLTGPWHHRPRPLRDDLGGARPAGRPFLDDAGQWVLPVQDCVATYGAAVRGLRITLDEDPDAVAVAALPWTLTGARFAPDAPPGCHTLSDCGDGWTLVDVKRVSHSPWRHWINLQRSLTPSP